MRKISQKNRNHKPQTMACQECHGQSIRPQACHGHKKGGEFLLQRYATYNYYFLIGSFKQHLTYSPRWGKIAPAIAFSQVTKPDTHSACTVSLDTTGDHGSPLNCHVTPPEMSIHHHYWKYTLPDRSRQPRLLTWHRSYHTTNTQSFMYDVPYAQLHHVIAKDRHIQDVGTPRFFDHSQFTWTDTYYSWSAPASWYWRLFGRSGCCVAPQLNDSILLHSTATTLM